MIRFRRVGTAFVVGVHFLTNVAATHAVEKSLWKERRDAVNRASHYARHFSPAQAPMSWTHIPFDGGSIPSQPPSTLKHLALPFDVASAVLPYGAMGEVQEGRRGAPVVFLIQDVHGNAGAQKNIGGLLGALSSHEVTMTGVEGAWVPFDLSAYHRPSSLKAVSLVSEALRAAGRLSGAEWAALTSPVPPTLVGVESSDLYRSNVAAARDCVVRRPLVATFLNKLNDALQTQKDRYYSPPLKSFDLHVKEYQSGREGLAAYCRSLSLIPEAGALSGAQVKKFLIAMEWESRLNFDKVEVERQALMDRLAQDLDQRALKTLLSHAVAYRTGKQTNGDFFSYLKTLCLKTNISLASYPSFADYISYVGVVQSICRVDFLNELTAWENDLGSVLAHTPEERGLLAMDRDASLLRQLLENEMSPEAWALFRQRRNEIVSLPARLRGFGDFQDPPEGMSLFIRAHEDFCRLALERNGALVSNFLRQVETNKATKAILVTGGFHTPGLQSELAKRGCPTIVLTPRIEKVEGKPLDVFARDPLPFDQLFAGKPISLSPELMLGNPKGRAFFDLLIAAENAILNPDSEPKGDDPGVKAMTYQKNGGVRLTLKNGGAVLAGLSNEVPKNHIPSETYVLSNGHSISVFLPEQEIGVWDWISTKLTHYMKQAFSSLSDAFHRSANRQDWNKFGFSLRRLFHLLFPLPMIARMTIMPFGSNGPVEVWTSYWNLGMRSMAGRRGYNSGIDSFFESFFQKIDPKSRLLDVGGGAGYFGDIALKISPEFSVVELDVARVPEKSRFRGLQYVRAYAERMPFQNGSFDGVVDSYSLAYTDIAKSIDEMFRVLKPGGKAALLLHSPDSDLVNGSKNNHASLVRHGWDETILFKIEEFLKRTTPAERKKELISEFVQIYSQFMEEGISEEQGGLDSMAGPLDILANLLFDRADRAASLVELYRVSFSVWHELFKAADQVPTNKDDVARLFTQAGFVVDRLEVFRHDGFSQGWAIELTKPRNSDAGENRNDIEFVKEENADGYRIMANNRRVGIINFTVTDSYIVLKRVLISVKGQGYGTAAVLKVAKMAGQIESPAKDLMGRPCPLVVTHITNPWTFKLLKGGIFETGSMQIVEAFAGTKFQKETAWRDPFKEADIEFLQLTGGLNINPESDRYDRYFHAWGVLRPEFNKRSAVLETPIKGPLPFNGRDQADVKFTSHREGGRIKLNMLNSLGNIIGSLEILGYRGEVTLINIRTTSDQQGQVLSLLEEAARIALFPGGEGRIFIPRVGDKEILSAALSMFDRLSLFVAKSHFARSLKSIQWNDRVDPRKEENLFGLLRENNQIVDICGTLSEQTRQGLWGPANNFHGASNGRVFRPNSDVEIVEDKANGIDKYQIRYLGREVGKMDVGIEEDVVTLRHVEVFPEYRGRSFSRIGFTAILHFAKLSARILLPKQNSSKQAVPIEGYNVANPSVYKFAAMLFTPGTLEIEEVDSSNETRSAPLWKKTIREGDSRFAFLTGPGNIGQDGQYLTRFHLRGVLVDEIFRAARGDYTKTSLPVLARQQAPPDSTKKMGFTVDRSGLALGVGLADASGKRFAGATVEGKRGAIELRNISVEPGDPLFARELLAGAVKEFLLLKGQGRVLLCKVKDPHMKRAAKELFGDNLVLARSGFGRSLSHGPWKDALDPASYEINGLLDDPTIELDLAGSLTPGARESLWPNEELPALVTADASLPVPKVIFTKKVTHGMGGDSKYGIRENDFYNVLIDGQVVGTANFFETSRRVVVNLLIINEELRGNGFAKDVYSELAKRASLILNPATNSDGVPVPLRGRITENPIAYRLRAANYAPGTIEVLDVGNWVSNESFDTDPDWSMAAKQGSDEFNQLIGASNVYSEGPRKGKYERLFDSQGSIEESVLLLAHQEFLQRQLSLPLAPETEKRTSFGLFGLSLGGSLEPFTGFFFGVLFVVLAIYKDKLMGGVKDRGPPWATKFLGSVVPDLSDLLPAIALIANKFLGLARTETIRILRRFLGPNTFRQRGEPRFFGWSLTDMLSEMGFVDVELIKGANDAILVTGGKSESKPTELFPGITVKQRSALDSLSEEEKRLLTEALVSLMPKASDMRGVEVSVGPIPLTTAEVKGKAMGNENERVSGDSPNEMGQKLLDPSVNSIVWAGLLALQPLGEQSLYRAVDGAVIMGNPEIAGAALAALDDGLRYPHGPDQGKIAEVISALTKGGGEGALQQAQSFADSYNTVQSELLFIRSVGGQLRGKHVLFDLTELFKKEPSEQDKTRQTEIWRALAGGLSALRQDQKNQTRFMFIVRDQAVSREQVESMLGKMLPTWDIRRYFNGDSLLLASEDESSRFFTEKKFILGALRAWRPAWRGPVQLVGFDAKSLLETETVLTEWGAELVPLPTLLDKAIERIIKKLEFVSVSA
ncbi:MAG: methyltransferase domain-containing protein [Elusimicrobia bacterium]|nr:methyltransferase domain-containing protein [Elusimicrobiota bacterium]